MTFSTTTFGDGKYAIVHEDGLELHILRNGLPWLSSEEVQAGKMLLAAAHEIDALRAAITQPEVPVKITWNADGVRTVNGVPDYVAQPIMPDAQFKAMCEKQHAEAIADWTQPVRPTEEMERWPDLADDLFADEEWQAGDYDDRVQFLLDQAARYAILMRAAQPVEPFAWAFQLISHEGQTTTWFVKAPCDGKADGVQGIPLYTAQQPTQAALDAARYRKLRDHEQNQCVINGELLQGKRLDHAVDNLPNTEANKC